LRSDGGLVQLGQRQHRVRTDVAGSAGDEDVHGGKGSPVELMRVFPPSSASPCASSPPGGSPVYRVTPTWGNNDSLGCGGCHAYSPALSTGSHGKHFAQEEMQQCYPCHNWSNSNDPCMACHDNATIEPRRDKHANRSVDVSFAPMYGGAYSGTPQPGDGYGTCSNVYCHGATLSGGTNTTPAWGGTVVC